MVRSCFWVSLQKYGVFIEFDHSGHKMKGLCHISEVSLAVSVDSTLRTLKM